MLKEHFSDEGEQFAKDLFWELSNFEKSAQIQMIVAVIIGCILAVINYYIQSISEEFKTYFTTVVFGSFIIFLFRYDLGRKLNKSSYAELKKYRW